MDAAAASIGETSGAACVTCEGSDCVGLARSQPGCMRAHAPACSHCDLAGPKRKLPAAAAAKPLGGGARGGLGGGLGGGGKSVGGLGAGAPAAKRPKGGVKDRLKKKLNLK